MPTPQHQGPVTTRAGNPVMGFWSPAPWKPSPTVLSADQCPEGTADHPGQDVGPCPGWSVPDTVEDAGRAEGAP